MGSKLKKWRTGIDCVDIYPRPPRLSLWLHVGLIRFLLVFFVCLHLFCICRSLLLISSVDVGLFSWLRCISFVYVGLFSSFRLLVSFVTCTSLLFISCTGLFCYMYVSFDFYWSLLKYIDLSEICQIGKYDIQCIYSSLFWWILVSFDICRSLLYVHVSFVCLPGLCRIERFGI